MGLVIQINQLLRGMMLEIQRLINMVLCLGIQISLELCGLKIEFFEA